MASLENIVIADESALHFYLHVSGLDQVGAQKTKGDPLSLCADSSMGLSSFNTNNPLYGGEPVSVLVGDSASRRSTRHVKAKCCAYDLPCGSFVKLRKGLYLTSPQLTFARMARNASETELAAVGMALCARYYVRQGEGRIMDRDDYLVTPKQLGDYLQKVPGMRGSTRAARALRWVVANSGSPAETQMKLQFCQPLWCGGFALPFSVMNYDVRSGRLLRFTEQGDYCIDLVNPQLRVGLEYDGELYHLDASKDKRRRNALAALGWTVFPIDKAVLYNPEATEKAALQIARFLGIRVQKPRCWGSKFIELRQDLGLPV